MLKRLWFYVLKETLKNAGTKYWKDKLKAISSLILYLNLKNFLIMVDQIFLHEFAWNKKYKRWRKLV